MAINVVGFKWNGSDENHKYDYEALENIPTTDIGELDIDTTAEQGTDDGDLYRAIDSFSWSSVISGSILSVKKLFTSIITQLKTNTTTLAGLGDAATKTVVNNLERTTVGAVLDARQGQYLKTYVDENKVDKDNIADNLTTDDATKVLSAKQGKIIDQKLTVTRTTFTPTSGGSYAAYGGCYYEQLGALMHIHVGVSGLTANTNTTIYNMPLGKRPATLISTCGQGAGSNQLAYLSITDSGNIRVNSSGAYCAGDLYYMI